MLFVWPYIHSREWGLELKYSIRSVCDNYSGNVQVVVIGCHPGWLNDKVIKVRSEIVDNDPQKTTANHLRKALIIAGRRSFIWMADDKYLVSKTGSKGIARQINLGEVPDKMPGASRKWVSRLTETRDRCIDLGLSCDNYEAHVPILLTPKKLTITCDNFGILEGDHLLATAHFNLHKPPMTADIRYRCGIYRRDQEVNVNGATWLNHSNAGFGRNVVEYLEHTFKTKSEYER